MKKTKYIGRDPWYNTSNHPDMAPFTVIREGDRDVLLVEGPQYDAWAVTDALDLLKPHFSEIRRVDTVTRLPYKSTEDKGLPEWYWTVYETILQRSNAIRWAHIDPDTVVIPISDETSRLLFSEIEAQPLAATEGQMLDVSAGTAIGQLAERFQAAITALNNRVSGQGQARARGYFVKSGSCSTKHQYKPVPVYSGVDAVHHLLGCLPVARALKQCKARCFIVRPFDDRIGDSNEVRVFVRDSKVTGVSQQACYSVEPMLHMIEAEDMIAACQVCYDDFQSHLPEKHRFNYECTFDAYFTTDDDALRVHLIEINSEAFGWGPAGSSLFSWRGDAPPLSHESPIFYIAGNMPC